MKIRDIVARSGRNLRSSKIRTILTALAIAVGGFTLTITLAAGNGLREYTDKLVASNFDPSEMIVGRDSEISNNGAPSNQPKEYDASVSTLDIGAGSGGSLQVKRVTQDDIGEIKSLPSIESVRESYSINLRYVTREGQKKYTGGAQVYSPAQKPELKSGQQPGADLNKGEALLPEAFLGPLGFNNPEDAVGKNIQMTVQKAFSQADAAALLQQVQAGSLPSQPPEPEQKTVTFKVAGVTKKPATSFAVGQLPILLSTHDGRELYDFTTQGTTDYEKYLFVYARVKDGQNDTKLNDAKRNLESKGYYVQTSKDIQKAITQFVNILQIMVGVFGIITLIASVFGIINTQYISVLERTREIGLMKALGMRGRDVRRLFMVEATWIGFLGGIIGSLVGFATGILLNPWITKKLDLGAGNQLFIYDPLQIALMILALMVIATLAGFVPAYKAAKLDPIVALRRE